MPRGRKLEPLTLTDEQQEQLEGIVRSTTLPYALVLRARMILASAEGLTNEAVARRDGATSQTVGSGADASARPASRACTMNSDPVAPEPMTTTRWQR